MIISETKKFVFIHIPKTGGMSMRKALEPHATVAEFHGYTPPGVAKQKNKAIWKHGTAQAVMRVLGHSTYENMYKFAFVRNPWAWLVSVYFYIKKDKRDPRHNLANKLTFQEFAQWFETASAAKYPARAGQSSYICKKGKLIVDFVGRFEAMEADFRKACAKIGVKFHLPHKNATKHKEFRDYYDGTTVDLVGRMFATDINNFGYEFK